MKSFLLACAIAVIIAASAGLLLNNIQEPVAEAYFDERRPAGHLSCLPSVHAFGRQKNIRQICRMLCFDSLMDYSAGVAGWMHASSVLFGLRLLFRQTARSMMLLRPVRIDRAGAHTFEARLPCRSCRYKCAEASRQ